MTKIQIKPGLEIGDECKPFIIAEVGSNWRDFADCSNSITQAKLAGADAVKFQAYDHHSLYGTGDGFTYPATAIVGRLPLDWLPKLKEKADAVGIEFMCSAFSPELIDLVDPYVNVHKVASSEMCHVRMLEKLREIGKPVILSTGAQTEADIRAALSVLGPTPTVLLYCVAAYPATDVNLDWILCVRDLFNLPVGFSDHTTDVGCIPRQAIQQGAVVLEKHFTAVPEYYSPDRPHSITPEQLKRMVSSIKRDASPTFGPTREEQGMTLRHKRRLIATRDIPVGAALTEGLNFGIYRSLKDETHAFSPFMADELEGCVAKREVKAGDGIGPGDV